VISGALLRHDLRLLLRGRILWPVLLALLLGCVYAIAGGIDWYVERDAAAQAFATEAGGRAAAFRDTLVTLEENAAEAGHATAAGLPTRASRAAVWLPSPLAALSPGQSALYPFTAQVGFFGREDALFSNYQLDNPLALQAGTFDMGFVLLFLLPLALIALSFDVLAGDRESGNLRLLLAHPVSVAQLVWTRLLLRSALVVIPVLLLAVVGGLVAGASLGGLLAWVGIALAYMLFWVALVAWLVTLFKTVPTAVLALVTAWVALLLVLPSVVHAVVQGLHPPPSRITLVAEARAAQVRVERAAAQLMAEYMHDHPELANGGGAAIAPWMQTHHLVNREVERELAPLLSRFQDSLDARQRLLAGLQFMVPPVLAQRAFNDTAGTGLAAWQAFEARAISLKRDLGEVLGRYAIAAQPLSLATYDALPPAVEFRADLVHPVPVEAGVASGWLLLLAVLLGALARRRLRHSNRFVS
jgi:ABC-2 type transport system permease protein